MPITEGSFGLFVWQWLKLLSIVTDIVGNKSWITHRENGQLVTIDDFENAADELIWAFKTKNTAHEL
jgi:hypothetical protein